MKPGDKVTVLNILGLTYRQGKFAYLTLLDTPG